MRSRTAQFVCLLLLLSSLAVSDARAGNVQPVRTPGGVFIHNLLLHAAVDESEATTFDFGNDVPVSVGVPSQPVHSVVDGTREPAAQTAHVHAVTGNSL